MKDKAELEFTADRTSGSDQKMNKWRLVAWSVTPGLITPKDYQQWIDPAAPISELRKLLLPSDNNDVLTHKVSTLVNNPKNNDSSLIKKI